MRGDARETSERGATTRTQRDRGRRERVEFNFGKGSPVDDERWERERAPRAREESEKGLSINGIAVLDASNEETQRIRAD